MSFADQTVPVFTAYDYFYSTAVEDELQPRTVKSVGYPDKLIGRILASAQARPTTGTDTNGGNLYGSNVNDDRPEQ